jgi:methylmalonyl-CoA mutase
MSLFDEFTPADYGKWRAEAERELKGKSFEEYLVWNNEGISVDAYYSAESLKDLTLPVLNNRENNYWDIIAEVPIEDDIAKANKHALEALQGGASGIRFTGNYLSDQHEMQALLEGIQIEIIALQFDCGEANPLIHFMLKEEVENRGLTMEQMNVVIGLDPLGDYTARGYADYPENENYKVAAAMVEAAKNDKGNLKLIAINGRHFHNAGASATEELAFSLAQANEYLGKLTDIKVSAEDAAKRMQFTMAVGSGYFVEIAKIRALKILWANLCSGYGIDVPCSITAETSKWNKSIYSAQTNMLRSTTEVMAAIIGGVDAFVAEPFDSTYKRPDSFSRRQARNTQLVAKYEAFMDKIADPLAGSYYVEQLTHKLAEAAWKLFQEVQKQDGYLACLKSNFIQKSINTTCKTRDKLIKDKKISFVGVSNYVDKDEKMLKKIKKEVKEDKFAPEQHVKPLAFYRGPGIIEIELFQKERVK